MIKVNLLPREIYAARAQQQIKVVGIGLGVLLLGSLLAYYGSLFMRSKALAKELVGAQAELQKYERIDAEVKAYQQQENSLSSRYGVIQQLLRGTLTYPKFVEDFMALFPSDIWINTLTTATDPSYALAVTVDAKSLSSFAIADWLSNLQSSPLCSAVRLGTINVEEQGEGLGLIYSFTLNFRYQRTEN
ncbi:MAG: PilN domain-containing protein [Elusimicrobia bacterium]|jgi:Tfp pilus assembly protein PilN|nr:PilN domain-containing protein [Elusimicrobiota bacterium]